jgi:hypothetical protein
MAQRLDAPVELSAALDALGVIYTHRGRIRDYLRVQQTRQRISRDEGFDDLREKLNILIENASALKMVGDYVQAIPLFAGGRGFGRTDPGYL